MDTADIVIVGGGSTGCVLASRLSEDPECNVVLLEEGPRDWSPYIHIPGAYYKTAQGRLLKRIPWVATQERNDAQPTMVQPSVLGGGSSVNAMIYIRGNPDDYERWEAEGATGWGYQDVLPYFKKAEDNNRFCNDAHGIGGPLGVSDVDHIHPLTRAWLQACQQSGMPYNPDFNSGDPAGCGLYQITARNKRRSSAATAYLNPARKRKNLSIVTRAQVTRIIVENGRAVGVEYTLRGKSKKIRASQDVISSAGAINSPKLLMLSGIGPADELRRHGIEVQQDLPGVGQNLQDHIEISLVYQLNGPHSYDKYKKPFWKLMAGLEYALFKGGPASSNLIEGGGFWWADRSERMPDLQYFMVVGAGVEEGVETVPGGNGCTINLGQIRPRSRGDIRLASSDPSDFPKVRPNYFSDPYDLEIIAQGTKHAMEIMQQSAISKYVEQRHEPAPGRMSMDEIKAFCAAHAHAALHPSGTCRTGTDPMSVVDPKLRVHGVDGLRVADASIMPSLISGNPNAVCIMIGEKLSAMMRSA
ncbi:GMC family oxidoreductase [Ruegeria atlantica]|uniref:GMC family oxidoreductase n=1 Tax=Ruegeria atlantica TaxID=81569 RepID=UPI0034A0A9C1